MKQILISSSLIISLSFALTSHAGKWEDKLVDYADKIAKGDRSAFCEKSTSVRSSSGEICNKSDQIAAYVLLACGLNAQGDKDNAYGFLLNEKKKPSECYDKASKKIGTTEFQKGTATYDILLKFAGQFVTSNLSAKTTLCKILPVSVIGQPGQVICIK